MPTYAIRLDPTCGFPGDPLTWICFTIGRDGCRKVFIEDTRRKATAVAVDLKKLTPHTIAVLCGDE
jgi:hypothetical protein